jgi:hypothetical protein
MAVDDQFIKDVLAGVSATELCSKHGLSHAAVAARIRWAREHGKLGDDIRKAPPGSDSAPDAQGTLSAQGAGDPLTPAPAPTPTGRHAKTRAEILALINSQRGRSVERRLAVLVRTQIAAHEAAHGPNAAYRLGRFQWARTERLRMLGLTMTDIRRLRGILPDPAPTTEEAAGDGQ